VTCCMSLQMVLLTFLYLYSCVCAACVCRVLGEAVQRVGERDVLSAELREEYGLAGWMEDLQEVHNPSGCSAHYQQAEQGLAFRVRGAQPSCGRHVQVSA
jgi:hypothetical protein